MSLPAIAIGDFAGIFEAIHGVTPFPWQRRLAALLAAGQPWPEMLDLPTASGKTAVLDIALFDLALQADRGPARLAPVRIGFVVDRRIIVDAAADRAERIAKALAQASGSGPLARMAARLRHLAGDDAPPLLVRRLRGGLPREEDWARSPGQPTVLCSTVDQIGSRLLFRGYGLSDSMKPVHAGLLGGDALLLLDEAHLATPFAETLRRIAAYRSPPWCERPVSPWQVVSLSATPGQAAVGFALDDADRRDAILSRRLEARKPARLRLVDPGEELDARAKPFADAAEDLAGSGEPRRIAVVVNRVDLARAIHRRLTANLGQTATVLLLTGRTRALDRDALLAAHADNLLLGAAPPDTPLIVVATQTIEAGADFDFDALITEAAPLDALRQRFGRLNRAGRPMAAEAMVIAFKDAVAARAVDAIYGDRLRLTWAWLLTEAGKPAKGKDAAVDFGIAALDARLATDPAKALALSSDKLHAPILRPADLLLLSWTAPIPAVDPAIALFLHGPKAAPADVTVVWRADLSEETLDQAAAWIALAPPHAGETLQVPLWTARRWLARSGNADADLADLEGVGPKEARVLDSRPVLRWAGADAETTGIVRADALRPGDVIVVPSSYGGCDSFGWSPDSGEAVVDFGNARPPGQRAIRRLHQNLCGEAWPRIAAILDDQDLSEAEILAALVAAAVVEDAAGWRVLRPEAYPGVFLVATRAGALAPATEDDAAGLTAQHAIALDAHAAAVAAQARRFAEAAGLSAERVGDVVLAARLHDEGKRDPRFQAMLRGGDRLAAALQSAAPLAKSAEARTPAQMQAARRLAGLPERWRHEAQSVTRAIADAALAEAVDQDLVLWLIGTHHGHGRPFFPHHDPREPADAPGPQRMDFLFEDRDWPQLYEVLKGRYGLWELARMEAVLRLADHRASAEGGA